MWSLGPQREKMGPQAVPVKTQPGLVRSQSLEKRQWASGSSFPASRLCCGLEPQAARTRGVAGRAAQRRLVPRVRPAPTPGEEDRDPGTAGGTQRRTPTDTRQLSAETGKLNNVAQDTVWGTVSLLAANYSPDGTRGPKKRLDRFAAFRDTARPRHASLPIQVKREQDLSRPANELSEQDSCGLAKPRSLERGYRERETNALNGDPRVWTPSH